MRNPPAVWVSKSESPNGAFRRHPQWASGQSRRRGNGAPRRDMTTQPAWVLVVDDDPTDRLLLFRLLEREGHHATVADNGRTALELLRSEPFDLVLLDLLMPDVDGYGVLQAMKSDGRLAAIPVIMISGVDELDAVVRCIQLGADDYVDKPVDPVLLRARVDAALTRKRLREDHDDYFDVLGHLIQAATAGGDDGFDPQHLDPVTRRVDPLGQLARAVQDMATKVAELRARLPITEPPAAGAERGNRGDGQECRDVTTR